MLQAAKKQVKSQVKSDSDPSDAQSGETLPDGGDIGVAELRALAAENAAAEEAELRTAYEDSYVKVVEIPEVWPKLPPADRQGALQIAWLRYCANSYRLSGHSTEYAPVLALGWLDDECRSWIEAQIADGHWRKARYEKFSAAMVTLSLSHVSHAMSPAESPAVTGLSHVSHVSHALDIEPLPEIAPGAPFPIDALGEFAAAAEAIHEIVKTPLPICAASVLGSLSVCVQGAFDVVLDGRIEPLSLYLLTVAPSGARKSACDAILFRAIRKWDRKQGRAYYDELQDYKRILARHKGKGPPPEPPADPKVLFTDATGEAVQRDARRARYGTRGLVTDEGGRFFGGWSLTAERRLAGLSVYSALWDGGEITVRRMGEGASYTLHDRRVMLHIQVQAAVVRPFLTDPLVACQGLLGRFLVAQVDTVPAREYVRGNAAECPGMERLYATHEALLSEAIECKAIDHQLDVRSTLTLDKAAIRYWAVVHDGFEKRRAATTDEALASFYGKSPAHVLRIAGVLAAAHGEGDIVKLRIQDASRIVQWYAADMERAQDVADVSSSDGEVLAVKTWLLRRQGQELTVRDIQRGAPRGARRGGVKRVREIMARLIETGFPLSSTKGGWVVSGPCDTCDSATNQ